jgi:hypothetical protein
MVAAAQGDQQTGRRDFKGFLNPERKMQSWNKQDVNVVMFLS